MKGPPVPPPPTTTPRRQPPPPPPASRECACGVCVQDCELEFNECDGNTDNECCKCINRTPGCFPAEARISLENGKAVKMSELKVGDRVQTGKKSVTISEFLTEKKAQV